MSDEQDPEFGWLYGAKGKPEQPPAGAAPDATRAMPIQSRPKPSSDEVRSAYRPKQAASTPGGGTPTPPPPSTPTSRGTEYGGSRGPRLRRPSFKSVRRVIALLLVVWIGSLVWVGLADAKALHRVAYEPTGTRPADQPGKTYLVVGSDSRRGLTKAQQRRLKAGPDIGQRTDTIKLLHTGSGPTVMLTIPRDSYVPIPGHGSAKINAAFSIGGPKLLVKTIEADTGLRIDGYFEIGMGGLINLVNSVGGITICPTTDMDDPLARLDIKKGCQHVGGFKALGYSRSRHAQKLGDLGRGQAQSEVIGQIGSKLASPSRLLNPFALAKLKPGIRGITVGKGMSNLEIAKFGWAFKSVSSGKALQCGIPISDMYIHWDKARALKLLGYLKTDQTDQIPANLCTPSGLPKSVTG
ncbi:LCP family protein [Nocardioides sp. Kera G14]|uniref:LCP family protein n=1 Tax=Nocardioides sp. Kera G14 TaxID=2884264 RepID=UPI001D12F375|nr:LCP family protein [Nocardioides sp. Kera G14]UDY22763.1 LCP family protein [Nocardioides sp. Kera G14]